MCSQLHMRGASGEKLVDLLPVVTFLHVDWQLQTLYSKYGHTHVSSHGDAAGCNINSVLCVGKGIMLK